MQSTATDYREFLKKPQLLNHPHTYFFMTTTNSVAFCLDCAKDAVCPTCYIADNCEDCNEEEACGQCEELFRDDLNHQCVTQSIPGWFHYGVLSSMHILESDVCGGVSCKGCGNPIMNANGCYGDGIDPDSQNKANPSPCGICLENAEIE